MVRHILRIVVVVMFAVQLIPTAARVSAQDTVPEGVPQGSEPVTVHREVDGEKVYVRRESGDLDQVLLSGLDVPEEEECFFQESKDFLADLIPKGTEVYLEQSGTVDR